MAIQLRADEIPSVVPANWVPGPPQGSWTYEAYAALPDDGLRYEIVKGVLIMAPALDVEHQRKSKTIFLCFYDQVEAKDLGEVLYAPVDVELSKDTVFQPDLVVILHEHRDRIHTQRIIGAPDLVLEIISPSSIAHDRATKRLAYGQAGVPEYWLVDPVQKTIELFVLEGTSYTSLGIFADEQSVPSRILPALRLPVKRFIN